MFIAMKIVKHAPDLNITARRVGKDINYIKDNVLYSVPKRV